MSKKSSKKKTPKDINKLAAFIVEKTTGSSPKDRNNRKNSVGEVG
jgi:hypothetical protein